MSHCWNQRGSHPLSDRSKHRQQIPNAIERLREAQIAIDERGILWFVNQQCRLQSNSPGPLDGALAAFLAEGLQEQADAEQIGAAETRDEQERLAAEAAALEAVEQGFPMSRRINAIVSVLEKISPARGDLAVRLLGQAHAYLKKPGVAPPRWTLWCARRWRMGRWCW